MPKYTDEDLLKMAGLEKAKSGPKPKKQVRVKKKVVVPPVKLSPDSAGEYSVSMKRGLTTNKERSKDLAVRLSQEGFDPVDYILGLLKDSDDESITDLDRVKTAKDLLPYMYQKQKSVEVKEEKDWKIEVIQKQFKLNDNGEVITI